MSTADQADRGYTRGKRSPRSLRLELIPSDVRVPKPVAEANERAGAAIDALHDAQVAAKDAANKAADAPLLDARADADAAREGQPLPTPTAPAAIAAADVAKRLAVVRAIEAEDLLKAVYSTLAAHRDEVLAEQSKVVEQTIEQISGQLDKLDELFGDLGRAVGAQNTIYTGRRRWRSGAIGSSTAMIQSLRLECTELRERAKPMKVRLLEAVSVAPKSWSTIAMQIGRSPIDSELAAAREWLIEDGVLAWTDESGAPLAGRTLGSLGERFIVRVGDRRQKASA